MTKRDKARAADALAKGYRSSQENPLPDRLDDRYFILRDRHRSVTEAFPDVGFKDMSDFGLVFRKVTDQPSSRYRHPSHSPAWERCRATATPRKPCESKKARKVL